MGINIGNTKIKELYVGNTKIKEAYVGNVKVYGNEDELKRYIKFSYNGVVGNIAGYRMKYQYVNINDSTNVVTTEYNPSSGWISPDPFLEGSEDKPKLLVSLSISGQSFNNENIFNINPSEIDIYAEYSYDGINWNWYKDLSINALSLSYGQELYFRSYKHLFQENVKFLIQEGEIDTTTIYTKSNGKDYIQCYKITSYEYEPVSSKTITKNLIEVSGNLQGIIEYNCANEDYETLKYNDMFYTNYFFTYCGIYLYKADKLVFPWNDISSIENTFIYMFLDCTSLITAPKLKATTLAKHCYSSMFEGCTSLTTAPDLPATTLTENCYNKMFLGCTSLTTAPDLPATILAEGCYSQMFYNCTSLTKAPDLPATILAEGCYVSMFNGCTSLTTAPDLSATTLAKRCYSGIFANCTSLTTAPDLPATTLTENCYASMFYNCTSLTKAPDLPATTLAAYCYSFMFQNCTNLSSIKLSYTGNFGNAYFANWVFNVASSGTLYYDGTDTTVGYSAIPKGWTKSKNYLKFTSRSDDTWIMYYMGNNVNADIYYSTDAQTWTKWNSLIQLPLNNGDSIYVWNKNNTLGVGFNTEDMFNFSMHLGEDDGSRNIEVSGNVNSMINFSSLTDYCYIGMFQGFKSLTKAPELPATTLAKCCYVNMFRDCTKLTKAPDLPATILAEGCYSQMFYNCTSLTKAPDLPATTLAQQCYEYMFYNCTSLTEAPNLHATTLANYCYQYMFQQCYSLTKAPDLPATTLTTFCYTGMFMSCYNLTKAPDLPATTLAQYCYSSMFYGCNKLNYIKINYLNSFSTGTLYAFNYWVYSVAPTGDFYYNGSDTTLGVSAIPVNWNIKTFL